MGSALDKLVDIGSAPICTGAPELSVDLLVGAGLKGQLQELLARKNGFFAFESALHVFPSCARSGVIDLAAWNSDGLWRQYYGTLAEGCLFFAEDVFGFQFAIKDNLVWSFNAETADLTELGNSLESWARTILNDFQFQTGYPFAHKWQSKNRALLPTERLFPKRPFVLGGKYELSNLVASDAVYGMQFRGYVAQQIMGLPDGTQVEFVFSPPS